MFLRVSKSNSVEAVKPVANDAGFAAGEIEAVVQHLLHRSAEIWRGDLAKGIVGAEHTARRYC